jgi:hypothetical protein
MFRSRARYLEHTREHGCQPTGLSNDWPSLSSGGLDSQISPEVSFARATHTLLHEQHGIGGPLLLIELIAAFQKIPQRHCLLCKTKTSVGIEGHKPGCPLLWAFNFIKAAQQKE